MSNFLSLFNPHDNNSRYLAKTPQTSEQASALFTAMNNPTAAISQNINNTINVDNVYIQAVTVNDMITGEERTLPRVVLIDDEGKSYGGTSSGIFNALEKLFTLYGTPDTWQAPITIKIKQVKVNRGSMLTFDLISPNGNMPKI